MPLTTATPWVSARSPASRRRPTIDPDGDVITPGRLIGRFQESGVLHAWQHYIDQLIGRARDARRRAVVSRSQAGEPNADVETARADDAAVRQGAIGGSRSG